MKRALYRALTIAAVVGAAGVAWVFLRPVPPVTVVVVNASQKPIAWAQVAHEKGAEMVGGIPIGESRTVHFRTHGETSYVLHVRFSDGSQVEGGGGYAEAGYRFRDLVSDLAVRSELELPAY